MPKTTWKPVQIHEECVHGGSVYTESFLIPFKDLKKNGIKTKKDKTTGSKFLSCYIFNFKCDCID